MKKVSIIIPVYNQEKLIVKALDSIPRRDDIEVIVIDDGSTDNTWDVITNYDTSDKLDLIVLANGVNKNPGYSRNKGIEAATGKYIFFLDSDDYLYTDKWDEFVACLGDYDMVYYNLQVNDGCIWRLNEDTKRLFCGTTKAIKRSFIGNVRFPDAKFAEDFRFYKKLLEKEPTEYFTDITLTHYNYPREGSLVDIGNKLNGSGTK